MESGERSAPQVSVVLPTYQERDNITELIEQIYAHLPDAHEVIVVDDDSPDLTWQIAEGMRERFPTLKVLRRVHERGLTSAIRDGVHAATGDVVVWMDCDLSMPPSAIPSLVRPIHEGWDAVVGSRYVPGGGDDRDLRLHKLLSLLICRLGSAVALDGKVLDCTSGFIAIRRERLEGFPWDADYGEYFITLMRWLLDRDGRILEVPYRLVPRVAGSSKTATNVLGFVVRGRKYLRTVAELRLSRH